MTAEAAESSMASTQSVQRSYIPTHALCYSVRTHTNTTSTTSHLRGVLLTRVLISSSSGIFSQYLQRETVRKEVTELQIQSAGKKPIMNYC